jgi:isopentenyl-diphosphate delta-isomerase
VNQPPTSAEIVSSDQERLILVDPHDRVIGTLAKSACHDGTGVLHRAFSLFVFNGYGELLIQQRAPSKRLWPSYWSNSCCSHPRAGESMAEAVERRVAQELGLRTHAAFVFKFEYRAEFGELGTEHELCWVYLAQTTAEPVINTTEISAWRWIAAADLDRALDLESEPFTPWFRMEWQRLRAEFGDRLAELGVSAAAQTGVTERMAP